MNKGKGKGHKKMDISGIVFTRWTAISCTNTKNISGSYLWNCICTCGKSGMIAASALISNQSKSCGCLSKDVNRELMTGKPARGTKPKGHVSSMKVYKAYRDNAKRKEIEFNIAFNDFVRLTSSNCYYCGVVPKQFYKSLSDKGDYLYNGLDRVVSNKGYYIENVVPCCNKCNRAKFQMSQPDFLGLVESIYKNRIKIYE